MERNGRKRQILQILADSPADTTELASIAKTSKHNITTYVSRYQKQGLIKKTDDGFVLTDRGVERLHFWE